MGSQSWFPSNNYPTDKATFDTVITVPTGEDRARRRRARRAIADNGDGTATWHWREDDPTATYLVTATVGDFLYTARLDDRDGDRPDAAASTTPSTAAPRPAQPASDRRRRSTWRPIRSTSSAASTGPYPFDSTGAVVDRAAGRRLRPRGPDQAALRRRLHERQPVDRRRAPSSTSSPTSGSATASRWRRGATSGSTRAGPTGPSCPKPGT